MNEYKRSPVNYTGNKYRLLKHILPMFPKDIDIFVDLFGGSGVVSLNIAADKIVYNDVDYKIVSMIELFKNNTSNEIIKHITSRVVEFDLGKGTDKRRATEAQLKENDVFRQNYLKFREFLNKKSKDKPLDLLTIHYFSFNNLIRNTKTKHNNFNVPSGVGSKSFNKDRHGELIENACSKFKNIDIQNTDFKSFDFSNLTENSFVYFDPPYFLSSAEYNKNWTTKEEEELQQICDELSSRNVKWAMSNMLVNNEIKHTMLEKWAVDKGYYIHNINTKYSGWAGIKNIDYTETKEVLVTNYQMN